jgi:hypothetical protein
MGKLTGTVLILAGIAVAAYTVSSSPQRDAALQVAAAPGDRTPAPAATPGPSPAPEPATAPAPSPAHAASAEGLRAPPQEGQASQGSQTPPATVTHAAGLALSPVATEGPAAAPPLAVNDAVPRIPVGDPKGGPALAGPALVREIQRHLKRIGCYRGELSGVWTLSSRDAMKEFTERANASLPVDRPDPVLLAMVQNQEQGICGPSCPAGQARAAGGRCVPSTLAANAAAAGSAKEQRSSKAQPRAGQGDASAPALTGSKPARAAALQPVEGRMSLSGPAAAEPRQVRASAPRAAPVRTTALRSGASYRAASARARPRYRTTARPAGGNSGLGWLFPF